MKIDEQLKARKWLFASNNWPTRTAAIAEIIPPEASIIELGAGMCFLHELLPNNPYTGIDKEFWTDKIIRKADFNAGEFPELGKFDVIVCQGVLEYIKDLEKFLLAIHKYGRRLILSYYNGPQCPARKNKMKFVWLENLLEKTGWLQIRSRNLTLHQRLYLLLRK